MRDHDSIHFERIDGANYQVFVDQEELPRISEQNTLERVILGGEWIEKRDARDAAELLRVLWRSR